MEKRAFLKELPISVWIRLLRAYYVISNDIRKSIGRKGLTIPQLYVVIILGVVGDLLLGELGKQMLVTKGNVTSIVDHLEKDGLAYRDRDTVDRRRVWVRLTDQGREVFEDVLSAYEEDFAILLGSLSADEMRQLSQLLKKLTDGILKKDESIFFSN
ncbi:MAG: MarR family transcriptional regulator [Thermodesulfobacteriota bacterium]|nr:MarR family transcriptional regulator [Thermodesulfobacteriota bacterium]